MKRKRWMGRRRSRPPANVSGRGVPLSKRPNGTRTLPLDRHRFSVSFLRFSIPFLGTLLPSSMCVQRGAPLAVRSVSFLRLNLQFSCTQRWVALPPLAYRKTVNLDGGTKWSVQRGAPHAVRTWMTVREPLETGKRNGETKRANGVYPEASGGMPSFSPEKIFSKSASCESRSGSPGKAFTFAWAGDAWGMFHPVIAFIANQ